MTGAEAARGADAVILQATRELVEVIGELVAAVRENTAAIRDAAPDRWRVLTGGGSDE